MKNDIEVAIAFIKMNTLSHFDFLFCLPSRLVESAVGGTKGKPLPVKEEAPMVKSKKQKIL